MESSWTNADCLHVRLDTMQRGATSDRGAGTRSPATVRRIRDTSDERRGAAIGEPIAVERAATSAHAAAPGPSLEIVPGPRHTRLEASPHTTFAYVGWIRRFVRYDRFGTIGASPPQMGKEEITKSLRHLAADGHVASSTDRKALVALLFLYDQ